VQDEGHRPQPGHTRSLIVSRASKAPLIDGKIEDEAWKDAAIATDFWISEYGRSPQESTEVRVLADEEALYVAFICHDSRPESIHAEQTKRDSNLRFDDHVTLELDAYHNHRQVSDFSVNALGTQTDAIAGGRARNIAWKGDWQTAVQRTSDGWTAEMRIPFIILNFQAGSDTFGVNFLRYHHRTQERSRWADVTPQYLPQEAGHLTGLILPRSAARNKLTFLPYTAAGTNTRDKEGRLQRASAASGVDIRYDITGNLSSVLSVNPDFSQVEDEVLGLGFAYNEKFRRDSRPFFQEGSAYFPERSHFHSGRVPSFDTGLKSFGKIGSLQVGLLGTQGVGGRRDYVARALQEIGPTTNASVSVVGRNQPGFDNQLIAVEFGGRIKNRLTFGAGLAATSGQGKAPDGTALAPVANEADGKRLNLSLSHDTDNWHAGVRTDQTDTSFYPASGFIAQDVLGTRGTSAYLSYNREYDEGSPLRRADLSVTYGERDTVTGLLQSRSLSIYAGGETRGNIQINLGLTQGPYRPRKKDSSEWAPVPNNDHFYTASAYFDTRSDQHGYGLTYSWGNLGGGRYSDLVPSLWWKPGRQTYLGYSYERVESFGVSTQSILSASWDINSEQAISARWVHYGGDYRACSLRLSFRQQARNGMDVFAVYDKTSDGGQRCIVKLVRALG